MMEILKFISVLVVRRNNWLLLFTSCFLIIAKSIVGNSNIPILSNLEILQKESK